MSDVIVDTYKLNQYAQRIAAVNSRISRLDRRLDSLYTRVGLVGLWNLMQADALTGYSWRLTRCESYLEQTAADFEETEKDILNEDLSRFSGISAISVTISNLGPSDKSKNLWDIIKSKIPEIPEDINSAGEALAWLEKFYAEFPHWATLGVEVLVPGSLKDAYILTSGILQGDLTLEEGWDVAKNILSENTKLAVICETLDYTFETGVARSEEKEKQMLEQLREGDVIGAVIDGAEGFVDTIIGGSIEVLGDVAGVVIDDKIEDIGEKLPVVKGINMLTEYGTGLLGWNNGEGYSVGGLIGGATEIVSDGIDKATDFITDTTDIVTDAVTDGIKTGIGWVKSWFD